MGIGLIKKEKIILRRALGLMNFKKSSLVALLLHLHRTKTYFKKLKKKKKRHETVERYLKLAVSSLTQNLRTPQIA